MRYLIILSLTLSASLGFDGFGLVPAAVSQAQARTLYMVSVGITNAIGQTRLNNTAKDASDMARWAQYQKGRMFHQVHVNLLINGNATRANIINTLAAVRNKARPSDYVIFYGSSHGTRNSSGEYVFTAYDGPIMWSQIRAAFRPVNGVKVAILDTCHAGAATTDVNLAVLAASQSNQTSSDGVPNTNGLYTGYLLQALYGRADVNKTGIVSLQEAAWYAATRLQQHSLNSTNKQNSAAGRPKNIPSNLSLSKVGPAASSVSKMGGTTWTGKENLGGYGNLSFRLLANGQAVMYDAKQVVPGTWSKNGNQVTIAFARVRATYRGTISGSILYGQGINSQGRVWTFRVARR